MAPVRSALAFPCYAALILALVLVGDVAAQTVWSGYTFSFTKDDFADVNSPENQDRITPNVWLTRNVNQGIYNIAEENVYITDFSPADTEWATGAMFANQGESISAANWQALTFTDWRTAYGGNFELATNITTIPAVVHLITDDVYLDLQFTAWSVGGGGGFAYMRAEGDVAVPPTGDYNQNGVVDAADYVLWRSTLDQTADPPGSGADGNQSGTIDAGDYTYWVQRFGNNVPGSGSAAQAAPAPEPAAAMLLLIGLIGLAAFCRRRFALAAPVIAASRRIISPPSLTLALIVLSLAPRPSRAAFHLWQVKEVFTNADGSIQFIELFNSFAGEHSVAGHAVRSRADGINTNFTLPNRLPNPPQTNNRHMLLATPGFAAIAGVTPDYTLPAHFINTSATNYTISFEVGIDSISFTSALLPKDGINSINDSNLYGAASLGVSTNSPTNFFNQTGMVAPPAPQTTGDYNQNGVVDAADYVLWRATLNDDADPAGSGADGDASGTIDAGDYTYWRERFGNIVATSIGSGGQSAAVPEPATFGSLFIALLVLTFVAPPTFQPFAHQQRHNH